MSEERFTDLCVAALDEVPDGLMAMLENIVLFVEDDPPAEEPHLLGLYEGVPLTERDVHYGGTLPDRITIFRNPMLTICEDEQQVIDEVRITVVHEIAHFFGIDDARLHELGYA